MGPPPVTAPTVGRRVRAIALVHPVPSAINAILVATLALIAGGGAATAATLAIAMLGFQFSIGAINDIADADADRQLKPYKPIPAGRVGPGVAVVVGSLAALLGLLLAASFGPVVLLLGAAGWGCGMAYDLTLRKAGLGWLCYAAAFPLLLTWTWTAAADNLPPGWPFLLPVAALAGPALHLANSLVDAEGDDPATRPSLATRLGPHRARRTLAGLMAIVLVLAWITLATSAGIWWPALAGAVVATLIVVVGVALSWHDRASVREAGWLLQAVGLATLAAAWLATAAS
jgi:4-hydroxybenzoate polyprenyltransferase